MIKKIFFCLEYLLIPFWVSAYDSGGLAYDFGNNNTKSGFLMGTKLGYNLSLTGDIEMSSGGGFDLGLGWRFSNNIGIKINYYVFSMHNVDSIPVSLSHQNQMGWGGFGIDVRYYSPLINKKFDAYSLIGVGGYSLIDADGNGLTGMGLNFGAGCHWFLHENFAVGPEIIHYPISYDKLATNDKFLDLTEKISGNTLSFSVLATYQF